METTRRPGTRAAVLAGGSSRRMGRDKRYLPVGDRPLLRRAVDAVSAVCDEVAVVVADDGPLPDLPASTRRLRDREPGEGPLGALVTALAAGAGEVLVVAGDHPALAPAVLARLLDELAATPRADGVALVDRDGRTQPLLAAYRSSAARSLAAAFADGERAARAVFDLLDIHLLSPDRWQDLDPVGASLQDIDTPQDLAAFEATTPPTDTRGAAVEVVRLGTASAETAEVASDRLATEAPLVVRAGGPGQEPVEVLTTLRTPGTEADLAVGWLFTEGRYDPAVGPAEVRSGDPRELARPEDTVTVTLPHALADDPAAHRHTVATGSCGVCGRASIEALVERCESVAADAPGRVLPADLLLALPGRLRSAQPLFAATGGVHATGLFDTDGRLVVVREDVGRHNALDAAIGTRLRAGQRDFGRLIAVLSGRVGFELVAKLAVAGVSVVVAVGAPTDLAVRTAARLGITLVGFVRDGRATVYSHPIRVR